MWEIFLALSNLYSYYPVQVYWRKGEYHKALSVLLTGLTSFFHHLLLFREIELNYQVNRLFSLVALFICLQREILYYLPLTVIPLLGYILSHLTSQVKVLETLFRIIYYLSLYEISRLLAHH